jgi:lipopolysaccharide export system protein LptA
MIAAGLMANDANALKSDKDQPILLDADGMEIDFNTGLRTYTGNVTVKQGTLLIRADKMVVKYKDEEIETATAYGKPATFRQLPDGQTEYIKGRAPRMIFDDANHMLHMYEKANLTQGANKINSAEIHYDIAKNKMVGTGTRSTASPKKDEKPGRVRIILKPKKKTAPETAK